MLFRRWMVVLSTGAFAVNTYGATLAFDQETYLVLADEPVPLEVRIVYGSGEPADLFSYGVRIQASDPGVISLADISPPSALDFNGIFGPGAMVDSDSAVLGIKGTISPSLPLAPYNGALVARYELVFSEVGPLLLNLARWQTVGPNEDVFVAGDGTSLDDALILGSAAVWVVTRPVLTLRLAPFPSADVEIEFETVPGVRYFLEVTENYEQWTDLTTTIGDGDPSIFVHTNARNTSSARGYRARIELVGADFLEP